MYRNDFENYFWVGQFFFLTRGADIFIIMEKDYAGLSLQSADTTAF